MKRQRIILAFDGKKWHVRRVAAIIRDLDAEEMVYRCDQPISNDHKTLKAAIASLPKEYRR